MQISNVYYAYFMFATGYGTNDFTILLVEKFSNIF